MSLPPRKIHDEPGNGGRDALQMRGGKRGGHDNHREQDAGEALQGIQQRVRERVKALQKQKGGELIRGKQGCVAKHVRNGVQLNAVDDAFQRKTDGGERDRAVQHGREARDSGGFDAVLRGGILDG